MHKKAIIHAKICIHAGSSLKTIPIKANEIERNGNILENGLISD